MVKLGITVTGCITALTYKKMRIKHVNEHEKLEHMSTIEQNIGN
mgnify:CR=1 FL=1